MMKTKIVLIILTFVLLTSLSNSSSLAEFKGDFKSRKVVVSFDELPYTASGLENEILSKLQECPFITFTEGSGEGNERRISVFRSDSKLNLSPQCQKIAEISEIREKADREVRKKLQESHPDSPPIGNIRTSADSFTVVITDSHGCRMTTSGGGIASIPQMAYNALCTGGDSLFTPLPIAVRYDQAITTTIESCGPSKEEPCSSFRKAASVGSDIARRVIMNNRELFFGDHAMPFELLASLNLAPENPAPKLSLTLVNKSSGSPIDTQEIDIPENGLLTDEQRILLANWLQSHSMKSG